MRRALAGFLFLSLCTAIVMAGGEAPNAAPATTPAPAAAAPGGGAPSYTVDPAKSWLGFTARQSGGDVDGRFDKFTAAIAFADANLAASKFDVQISTQSVNTQDDNRDTVLRDKDLFDSSKFPTAHFVSTAFTRKSAGQYEATGKLTIRDVTREIHLPFTFQTTQEGGKPVAWLKGVVGLNRLDYGVGQGEWQDTSVAENPVRVKFELRLLPKQS